ncbi:MAG: hypothetical protein ACJAVI_002361 [Candidatus Azotimanducaceae bacterium]|jgi:uncharacterized protein with von Willebrand factor type A (vWA) domain
MLNSFLEHLRKYRIPVSVREHLDLQHLFLARLISSDINEFYFLSRLCLIKDEKYFDRFDQAFATFFDSPENEPTVIDAATDIPWFNDQLSLVLNHTSSAEVKKAIREYKDQMIAQKSGAALTSAKEKKRNLDYAGAKQGNESDEFESDVFDDGFGESHDLTEGAEDDQLNADNDEGANISEGEGEGEGEGGERGKGDDGTEGEGSGGESGEGHSSRPAAGVRDDSDSERQHSATKVWEMRSFEEYDPDIELGTRNIKMALRRLRKFARTSSRFELDLAATIRATAKQGGLLDIIEVPERHNSVKVLLLLDIGGSMDEFAALCEQLFSAVGSEFKYLEIFYFHNFFYESLWTSSTRSAESRISTTDVLRKYGRDFKIIIVGDGNMARHELSEKGGSVERYNPESGELWLQRFQENFRKIVWLNPTEESRWLDIYTIQMLRRLMPEQMYHLSVSGIEQAMKFLVR